jgi:glycosyltransferase involved in cell wall biosynthesis
MSAASVIATVLNEVENVPRLVESLLQQTPPAKEIILVDGGSTDGTWEWLRDAEAKHRILRSIRDETCNLRFTPGPISKGRNVAIRAATAEIIACVDAGCTYAPDWLARLTGPLLRGQAEYALGGSCLDLEYATVWDVASAPFFGVKMSPDAPTKSCTARSMAFTKDLWQRLGGFPETVFYGEDTLFDLRARKATEPSFPESAKAFYRPQNSFLSACRQMGLYALSDGVLGVRRARLWRNAARCAAEIAALAALRWTWIPMAVVAAMVLHFAFAPDWLFLRTVKPRALLARLVFAFAVPWIVAVNRIRGGRTKNGGTNLQNAVQTER